MELLLKHNSELLSKLSKDDLDYVVRNIIDQKNKEKDQEKIQKKKKYMKNFVRNLVNYSYENICDEKYNNNKLNPSDIVKFKNYLEDFCKSCQYEKKIILIYDVITCQENKDTYGYNIDVQSLQLLDFYELVDKYPFINNNNISKLDKQFLFGFFVKTIEHKINNQYIVLNKKTKRNSSYSSDMYNEFISTQIYPEKTSSNKYLFLECKYKCDLFDKLFDIDGLIKINKGLLEYLSTIMQ